MGGIMGFIRNGLAVLCFTALTVPAFAKAPNNGFYNNADGSPIVDLLNAAQTSIAMELYEMDDPAVIAALRAAMQRGVAVHIVQDPSPLGGACKVFGGSGGGLEPMPGQSPDGAPHQSPGAVKCPDLQAFVGEVNASRGGRYVPFEKSVLCPKGKGCFQHGKMAVIDGSTAMISSGNFNVSNLCDRAAGPMQCDRDYSFVTNDRDIVNALTQIADADANGARYDVRQLMGQAADKITVGPYNMDAMVGFIDSARTSIQLENQYLKDPTMNEAIMRAAKRGVKVQVMVASECGFGPIKPSDAAKIRATFSAFDAAGVQSRVFTKNVQVGGYKGYLHAKALVIDGNRGWVGSVNGSTEALTQNREFGIFFQSSSDVNGLASILSGDFANPNAESWDDMLNCKENH